MTDYKQISHQDGEILVKTARKVVEEYLISKNKMKLDEKFENCFSFNSGVFVTLNDQSGLRGCIGFPLPDKKLHIALKLCAGLIGEGFSFEAAQYDTKDGGPPRGGEFMLAMDPARFGDPNGWLAHAESFFAGLAALDGTRLPGDRRYANRERTPTTGVRIPKSLHDKILGLSQPGAS